MSLLLQEDKNRPEVHAGHRSANSQFFGLRGVMFFQQQRIIGPVVPVEWIPQFPDYVFDNYGVVESGEI